MAVLELKWLSFYAIYFLDVIEASRGPHTCLSETRLPQSITNCIMAKVLTSLFFFPSARCSHEYQLFLAENERELVQLLLCVRLGEPCNLVCLLPLPSQYAAPLSG